MFSIKIQYFPVGWDKSSFGLSKFPNSREYSLPGYKNIGNFESPKLFLCYLTGKCWILMKNQRFLGILLNKPEFWLIYFVDFTEFLFLGIFNFEFIFANDARFRSFLEFTWVLSWCMYNKHEHTHSRPLLELLLKMSN